MKSALSDLLHCCGIA